MVVTIFGEKFLGVKYKFGRSPKYLGFYLENMSFTKRATLSKPFTFSESHYL